MAARANVAPRAGYEVGTAGPPAFVVRASTRLFQRAEGYGLKPALRTNAAPTRAGEPRRRPLDSHAIRRRPERQDLAVVWRTVLRTPGSSHMADSVNHAPAPGFDRPDRPRMTLAMWLIVIIASIGFLFDTYELLMTPLAGPPAIAELLNVPPSHPAVSEWMGRLLWITALCGGVFGLIGGWLTDRFGRKT